jgi:ribonuclease VapC
VIVDASAVLAILLREPGHETLIGVIEAAPYLGIGAPTVVETGIVLTARIGVAGKSLLARFLTEAGIEVIPFSEREWPRAVDAFLRFGKGRHPAALNFGDCLTYAVAQASARPLLCVGSDFPMTDLALVPVA